MNPHITSGIDVALLVFWVFVAFFVALVFYLRREDRREGYPLEDELTGRIDNWGGPLYGPDAKSFLLPFGQGVATTPTTGRDPFDIAARRTERSAGAPHVPTGNPLVDGIGPAAWADRVKRPDVDMEGHLRIVPLSSVTDFWTAHQDGDLTGWPVVGLDGVVAGTVTDLWIDRSDRLVRYIQLGTDGMLVPIMVAKVDRRRRRVVVDALNAAQFAGVPRPETPGQITRYEEDRVQAYFGGGYLYATPDRQEPLF